MLIVAILLSLVCPAVPRKYDLRKYGILSKQGVKRLEINIIQHVECALGQKILVYLRLPDRPC